MERKKLKPIPAVEIVTLGTGDEPPAGRSFVHVRPGVAGGFEVKGYAMRETAAKLHISPALEHLDLALEDAKLWAEDNGVKTVYVSQ